jgi:hypothetical protein
MLTAKQRIQHVLDQLPDDCSLEDIQYHLYVMCVIEERVAQEGPFVPQDEVERRLAVLARIEKGEAAVEAGQVITHDEMKRQFNPPKPK